MSTAARGSCSAGKSMRDSGNARSGRRWPSRSSSRSGSACPRRAFRASPTAGWSMVMGEIKPELHQSMVEVGTKVCHTPTQVRAELVRLRRLVMDLAAKKGLKVAAAGSHPFSSWMDQEITPLERYIGVREDLQDLA